MAVGDGWAYKGGVCENCRAGRRGVWLPLICSLLKGEAVASQCWHFPLPEIPISVGTYVCHQTRVSVFLSHLSTFILLCIIAFWCCYNWDLGYILQLALWKKGRVLLIVHLNCFWFLRIYKLSERKWLFDIHVCIYCHRSSDSWFSCVRPS